MANTAAPSDRIEKIDDRNELSIEMFSPVPAKVDLVNQTMSCVVLGGDADAS